jgi:hypothetical protein
MIKIGLIHCNTDGEGGGGSVGGESPDVSGGDPSADTGALDTSSGGDEGGIDWAGVVDIDGDDEHTSQEPVTDVTEPVVEPVVKDAPVIPAEPQAAQAEAPETPPAVPPVEPVVEPTPVPAAAETQTPEQQEAAKATARAGWVTDLTERYQLTEEQANGMRLEPEKVLPQIAAEMHAQVMEGFMQVQRNMLPNMVQSILNQNSSQKEGDEAFFGEWPELAAHRPLVQSMGQHWRGQNPSGTREDFIKEVGPLVWSAAKLSLQDLVNRGNGQASAPPPAAPPENLGGYSPAPQGGGGAPIAPAAVNNPFGSLAEEWETD